MINKKLIYHSYFQEPLVKENVEFRIYDNHPMWQATDILHNLCCTTRLIELIIHYNNDTGTLNLNVHYEKYAGSQYESSQLYREITQEVEEKLKECGYKVRSH